VLLVGGRLNYDAFQFAGKGSKALFVRTRTRRRAMSFKMGGA
jgi:hypothetical protein